MGIDMYLDLSKAQSDSVITMCQAQVEGCEALQQAIKTFSDDVDSLQGQAYDSAREFFTSVLTPLAQGGKLYAERLEQLIAKLPNDYQEMVDSKSWQEDDLLEKIQREKAVIAILDGINQSLSRLSMDEDSANLQQLKANNTELIRGHHANKRVYEMILEKLREFDSYSAGIFSELGDIEAQISIGLSQAENSWNATTGTFTIPKDLRWATFLTTYGQTHANSTKSEEEVFIENMMSEYGFDQETAQIIYEAREGLDEKFPDLSEEEKDYLLLRIIGSVSYGAVEGALKEVMWNTTAGSLADYFYHEKPSGSGNFMIHEEMTFNEIMQELGIDEEQSDKLYRSLTLQHGLSGDGSPFADYDEDELLNYANGVVNDYKRNKGIDISVEEVLYGIEHMVNKTDFTHQSITMATHLRPSSYPLINGQLEDLSGWEGDTTSNATDEAPSIKNGDYLADLDAVNLAERMEDGQSFVSAFNAYQDDLKTGQTNREAEFKENIDLEEVKDTIFSSLVPDSVGKIIYISPVTGVPVYGSVTDEDAMAYLKEHYPDSYNFIRSLEEEENQFGGDN